jgi:hypothetical protein
VGLKRADDSATTRGSSLALRALEMTGMTAPYTPLGQDARGDTGPEVTAVPTARTIDRLALQFGNRDGVMLRDLQPGTEVSVITRHTTYRLVVLDGAEQRVTVCGGRFPEDTEVRVDGATTGGSMLKAGWIGIGLCLELSQDHRRILTSHVRSLSVVSGQRP